MAGEKRMTGQVPPANALQPSPASGDAHSTFLNLRLEPFISSSLIDILDVLAHSRTFPGSVPSTPPPMYEPPPPSYSSGVRSIPSMSSLDLGRPARSIFSERDADSLSVVTFGSCTRGDSVLDHIGVSGASGSSSIRSLGIGSSNSAGVSSGSYAPRLQNELVLNVIMYEFLTGRPELSRTPSRDTIMTSSN